MLQPFEWKVCGRMNCGRRAFRSFIFRCDHSSPPQPSVARESWLTTYETTTFAWFIHLTYRQLLTRSPLSAYFPLPWHSPASASPSPQQVPSFVDCCYLR